MSIIVLKFFLRLKAMYSRKFTIIQVDNNFSFSKFLVNESSSVAIKMTINVVDIIS